MQDLHGCQTQNTRWSRKVQFCSPTEFHPKLGLVHYGGTGVCLRIFTCRTNFPKFSAQLWLSREVRLQLGKRIGLFFFFFFCAFWPSQSELLPVTEILSLMLPVMQYSIIFPSKSFIEDSDLRFRNLTGSQRHLSEPDSVPSIFFTYPLQNPP